MQSRREVLKSMLATPMMAGAAAAVSAAEPPIPQASGSHSVTIGWTYSQGPDVAVGFNVYRSTVTGGPYTQINTTIIPVGTLTFTDSVVVAGSTYFYVVDAQDANGVHSAQSLESLAAVIPQNPTTPGRPSIVVH